MKRLTAWAKKENIGLAKAQPSKRGEHRVREGAAFEERVVLYSWTEKLYQNKRPIRYNAIIHWLVYNTQESRLLKMKRIICNFKSQTQME